jgi:molecular chaperone GrpE
MSVTKDPVPRHRTERPAAIDRGSRRIDPVALPPARQTADTGPDTGAPAGRRPERPTGQRSGPPDEPRTGPHSGDAAAQEVARLAARLAERTADLQRVKAEYDNYRKRVQRDRLAVREIAVSNVLAGLLPVLDALEEARRHGGMTGGIATVTQVLEDRLAALGLESIGEQGDPFDPLVHEALTSVRSEQVSRPTCAAVLRSGYRVGMHLLRPAQVEVAEPADSRPVAG